MKKVFTLLCAIVAAGSLAFAQDVNEATDLYNDGAARISIDKAGAMESFEKALAVARECGEAGDDVVANCISIMPSLGISIAKELIKAGDFDAAVERLKATAALSEEFGDAAKAKEANALIPQTYIQQGNGLLKAKDFDNAITAYKSALEVQPTNGKAWLNLGQAYESAGQEGNAVEAYTAAAANGQEKAANKKLSNIFLKKATAANKAKNYAEAISFAEKSNSYLENGKAYYVAGLAAQNSNKNADAIKYFEKYLELEPSANNSQDVRTVVEALKKAGK